MSQLQIHHYGLRWYRQCLAEMQHYTQMRSADADDHIWLLEHPAVYTLGLNAKTEHLLDTGEIPVVQSDRGGQVTFHGPGQLIVYLLLDLKRLNLRVKTYVDILQASVMQCLEQHYQLPAHLIAGAPGVYIDQQKISALGVRVKRGCCYHGLSLNVAMDLSAFNGINPCGYQGLKVTQLADLAIEQSCDDVADKLLPILMENLGISHERSADTKQFNPDIDNAA